MSLPIGSYTKYLKIHNDEVLGLVKSILNFKTLIYALCRNIQLKIKDFNIASFLIKLVLHDLFYIIKNSNSIL